MKPMTARIAESIKILEQYEYDAIHVEDFLRLIAMTYEEYVPSEIVEVATEKFYTGNSLQERTAITVSELDSIETELRDEGTYYCTERLAQLYSVTLNTIQKSDS